jgi:hypothetical protein
MVIILDFLDLITNQPKTTGKEVLEDYLKAVDLLTINNTKKILRNKLLS